MAVSTIKKMIDRRMTVLSNGGSSSGFKITYGTNQFSLIYADVYGRFAFISRSNASSDPRVQEFGSTKFSSYEVIGGELYLRTGSWVRGFFIMDTDAVTVTPYSS